MPPSLWIRLRLAALVAGAAFLSAAPYAYYATHVAFTEQVRARFAGAPPESILEVDLGSIALVVVIAAVAGSLFAQRYRLPGLGTLGAVRAAAPTILILGPALGVLSYLLYARPLALAVPGYYPTTLPWALALFAKNVIFDEVVARYGMMTIVCGVAPRVWVGNALQAIFFTAVGFKAMAFFGLDAAPSPMLLAGVAASFGLHLLYGHLCARHGLLAAITLHAVVDAKILLHALLA